MPGPFDLTGQNIESTYQRILQTDGTSIYNGTGSLFSLPSAFPYTGSAQITGSLGVTGSIIMSSSNYVRFTNTGSGTNSNYSDLSVFRYPTYDTPALRVVRPDGVGFTLYRQGSANNFWVGDENGNRNMTLYSNAIGAWSLTAPGFGGDLTLQGGNPTSAVYASSIVLSAGDAGTTATASFDHAFKVNGPTISGSTIYNMVSFQASSVEKAAIRYDGGAYFSSSVSIATGSTGAMLFVKNPFDVTGGTTTAVFEHRWGVNALVQTQRYGIIVRTADATSAIGIGAGALQSYDYVTNAYGGIALNYLGGSVAVGRIILGTADDVAKFVVRGRGATNATTTMRVENTNASASLVVLDNGNVGVGTSSPSTALHVDTALLSPSTRISDFYYDYFIGYGSVGATKNSNYFQLYRNGSQTYYDQSSGGHYFRSGVSDLLRILSNGNTLIGTTTDSGFKLDVSGSTRITDNLTVTGSISTSTNTTGQSTLGTGLVVNNTAGASSINDFQVKTQLYNAIYVTSSTDSIALMSSPNGKLGFFGATPTTQSAGWSVANYLVSKSFDANTVTLEQLADVVGTILTELKNKGLLG